MNTKNYKGFLEEYKNLCEKYKLCITSCGCCNGPWISPYGESFPWDDSIDDIINHLIRVNEKNLNYQSKT